MSDEKSESPEDERPEFPTEAEGRFKGMPRLVDPARPLHAGRMTAWERFTRYGDRGY